MSQQHFGFAHSDHTHISVDPYNPVAVEGYGDVVSEEELSELVK
jgi:hypothetical protein